VPILPSAGKRIQELLGRTLSAVPAERESAVAQLTLLGPRTIPQVRDFLGKAPATGRLAALEVLERLGEARGLDAALPLTTDTHEEVAVRAIQVAAGFKEPRSAAALRAALSSGSSTRRRAAVKGLGQLHGLGVVEAVEPLLAVLLDSGDEEALRLDALESLSSLDRRTLLPALRRLAKDPSPALVRAAAALAEDASRASRGAPPSSEPASTSTLLAHLTAPRTASAEITAILENLVQQRSPALLPLLARRLETVSAEHREAETGARAKARLHLALAALGSRIALHDLRDMLKARPLHAARDLLAAAELVGDASLVPAIAVLAADEPRLAEATATAFRAIAARLKLRRTSRVIQGLRGEHKAALLALWPYGRLPSRGASRALKRKLR
jgi:HEAT repeat protein